MWNTKALKQNGKQRQRSFDKFDMEAEAEGNARRAMKDAGPTVLGRRISRENRKLDGYNTTACKKATDKFLKDHNLAVKKYVSPEKR